MAATPSRDSVGSPTDDYLSFTCYISIVYFLQQYNCSDQSDHLLTKSSYFPVNYVSVSANFTRILSDTYRLIPNQLADIRQNLRVHKYYKNIRWSVDHNMDSLPKSNGIFIDENANLHQGENSLRENTTLFILVSPVAFDSESRFSKHFIGPLSDEYLPYSGAGMSEFKVLQ